MKNKTFEIKIRKEIKKWYKGYEDQAPNDYLIGKIVNLFNQTIAEELEKFAKEIRVVIKKNYVDEDRLMRLNNNIGEDEAFKFRLYHDSALKDLEELIKKALVKRGGK